MAQPTKRPRDAHVHILLHGRALSMPSLERCTSREQCLATISEAARGVHPGRWLVACSMRSEGWDDPRPPTRLELDQACPGSPCCVWSFDQHTIVANTLALESAGIRRGTPDPAGGIIVRDDRGDPTGLLLESAAMLLWRAVPEPTAAETERHVRVGVDHLASLGFGEVHELHAPAQLGPALARLADSGALPMRVRLYAPLARIEEEVESARRYTRDLVTLDGAKIFVDGTLNARTAWMLEPYSDPIASHPCGTPMMPRREIEEAIRRVDRLGLPLAAHAIGDAAVRAVLDAVEAVRPRTPGFRIEHAELVHPSDVPRFARLGVACSVQPCHLLADIEALRRSLSDRLDRVLPLSSLISAGCVPNELLLFGSDVPIVRADPGDSIQAAVHRRRPGCPEDECIAPAEAISEHEAWSAFGVVR